MTGPQVVVVGGGLGGLAAAVALRAVGADTLVLERASVHAEVGAGITLFTNGLRALEHLALGREVRSLGSTAVNGGIRNPAGSWLARSPSSAAAAHQGLELLTVRRADLQALLLSRLPEETVRTAVTVTDVQNPAGGPATVFSSEGAFTADLVVAADGIRSDIRQRHWPDAAAPRYAGFTAWRGITAAAIPLEASETWGSGCEFGMVPLGDGRVYWFATANLPPGQTFPDERQELVQRFSGWHQPIADVLATTPAAAVLRHDVYELPRPYLPFVRERIALLGDAAHAMTPNAGQGGCQALEDAAVLAASLRGRDIDTGLRTYDRLRRKRTQRIARASAAAGRLIQGHERSRDTLIRVTPPALALRSLGYLTRWKPPSEIR